jgi:hypothetical protein
LRNRGTPTFVKLELGPRQRARIGPSGRLKQSGCSAFCRRESISFGPRGKSGGALIHRRLDAIVTARPSGRAHAHKSRRRCPSLGRLHIAAGGRQPGRESGAAKLFIGRRAQQSAIWRRWRLRWRQKKVAKSRPDRMPPARRRSMNFVRRERGCRGRATGGALIEKLPPHYGEQAAARPRELARQAPPSGRQMRPITPGNERERARHGDDDGGRPAPSARLPS